MTKSYLLLLLFFFSSCIYKEESNAITCLQITHRDGLEETISEKSALEKYKNTNFSSPQNYLRVVEYKKNKGGRESSIMTYHENGSLSSLLETRNARAHGKYYQYHDNGSLYIQSTVIEGRADLSQEAKKSYVFEGPIKIFNEKGNLISQMHYKRGRLDGDLIDYWPNAMMKSKKTYINGSLEGLVYYFSEKEQIVGKKNYIQGAKHAKSYWDKNYEEYYDHGLLIQASYTSPGLKQEYQVCDGNGVKPYHRNQKLIKTIQIQNGIKNGQVQEFSANGNLVNEYTMLEEKKEGLENCYFDNKEKKLHLQIPWLEDEVQGVVKSYYKNQQLESQTEMAKNKKCGLSITYYENGSLMMMETYKKGKLIKGKYYPINESVAISNVENGGGLATIYTNKGDLLRTIEYKNSIIQVEDDDE